MSLFRKIIKTELVSGLHILSSVVKFTHKILAFLKPLLTTLYIRYLESYLQRISKTFIQSLWLQITLANQEVILKRISVT